MKFKYLPVLYVLVAMVGQACAGTAFQIRIVNAAKGPVQVRLGTSGPWATLGEVTAPATRTAPGFAAARWSREGTVAAVAVHGLRMALMNGEHPAMISVVPREFAVIPNFYGGHIPGQSGIQTNIRAGEAIFREWAPITGSPVRLETARGPIPLPTRFVPASGDVFLIDALLPEKIPETVVFENRAGGAVMATYAHGETRQLGTVAQTVRGTGRYDGTSFTGIGAINTNHPGVITIGTAPVVRSGVSEGAPPERRGGFMIQPLRHARDESPGTPQVLAVAPMERESGWEGRFPLFFGALNLRASAEMQVDRGDWEPFPAIVGRENDSLTAAGLSRFLPGRTVKEGLTAIRLRFAPWEEHAAREQYESVLKTTVSGEEPSGSYQSVRGEVALSVRGTTDSVAFYVNGALRAASNQPGFTWRWDTSHEKPGRYWVELRAISRSGETRTQVKRLRIVP